MSATDLDLPVMMSADHVRRREFVATRRGYDPTQVRDFLEQVADQLQEMEGLLRDARSEADAAVRAAAQPKVDPYTELAGRVAGVIRSADEEAERIRREARAEAERILGEARADADRIRADAQARAEETRAEVEAALREAREQADRTLAGLSTKRDALVDQLAAMQERLVGVARDLESTISAPDEVAAATLEEREPVPAPPTRVGAAPPSATDERTIVIGEAEPAEDAVEAEMDDEARMELLDPAFEELWDGTEAIALDVPDIPPLDLEWGDAEDDAEPADEDDDR